MSRVFVDTNIFVTAIDERNPGKMSLAQELLIDIRRPAFISTQVLQEFYVAATRRIRIQAQTAREMVYEMRSSFEVEVVSSDCVCAAINTSVASNISFWDALLFSSAKLAGCDEIWTEDLNAGQSIAGIRIVNPFAVAV